MSRRRIQFSELEPYYAAAGKIGNSFLNQSAYAPLSEDAYFNNATRATVLSQLRREIRNNPFLAAMVLAFADQMGTTKARSRTSDKEYNAQKDLFFYRWYKSCTTRGESWADLEEMIWIEAIITGECFLIQHADGRLQPISSEFCGSPLMQADAASNERNGIIYNKAGRPAFYRFGKLTPQGFISYSESTLVPARDVIHFYRKDRVNMGRGLPWLLTSLEPARNLHKIFNGKVKQIQNANKLGGFITSKDPEATFGGLGQDVDAAGNPITETADSPADRAENPDVAERVIELKDGSFIALDTGEDVKQLMSQYNAEDFDKLVMLMLHAQSAPVGLPVELWFSGLGKINYSGFKGLGTQWGFRRRSYARKYDGKVTQPVHFWRTRKALNEGDLAPNPDDDDDLIEFAREQTAILDDEKASKSNKTKLETGESSLADIWEEKGLYEEEVIDRRRQTFIKALKGTGQYPDGFDFSKIIVPLEYLLFNRLDTGTGPADNKTSNKNDHASNQDQDQGEQDDAEDSEK